MDDAAIKSGVAPLELVASAPDDQGSELRLNHRHIATFRATLLGDTASDRARLASIALLRGAQSGGAGAIVRTHLVHSVRFELDGVTLFYLVPQDIDSPRPEPLLESVAQSVEDRLRLALSEYREANDPRTIAKGIGFSAVATGIWLLLTRLLFVLKGRWVARLEHALQQRATGASAASGESPHFLSAYLAQAVSVLRVASSGLVWVLAILMVDAWVSYVLHQFAYTRPWGERSTAWLLELLQRFVLAAADAVPGLVVASLIFVVARLAARAVQALLGRVERGEVRVSWLDVDTAVPTRRLATVAIWLFATAMAYPYLPGANSDAFKGLTVLTGVMISLGASGLVGQALSGLSLMYSRSLRVGEYIKAGEVEGTVIAQGMFTTRVQTGSGEEVNVPNTVLFSLPIRNFSRMARSGHFVFHVTVTIGYSTPWRQVHAMLLEAARRSLDVAKDPPPYVLQVALSDFYVEYRLCVHSNNSSPGLRMRAISELHGHVQDVFSENGVQIMSPHYIADPDTPQLPEQGPWTDSPYAQPLQPPKSGTNNSR